jgi:subtilase family serine protease
LPSSLTPAQVQTAYGFNLVSQTGTGETIAIVDAYDDANIASDLATFDNQFGLPGTTAAGVSAFFSKINENGGSKLPAANPAWATEISLDVEWAHAIAPGAKIVLVEASTSSFADLFKAVDTASSKTVGAQVVSMSWGGNEFSGESGYDSNFAGHTGIVYIASSGDDDYSSYPAASPYVLSVGGTSLYTTNASGAYGSEKAWDYSGGGESVVPINWWGDYVVGEAEPAYQTSVQNTGVRITPDVAYNADPNTGFAVYDSVAYAGYSGWQQYGGTSAGAPQWAGLVARVDQGRTAAGKAALDGPTQLLPTLYTLSSSNFHSPTTDDSGTLTFNGYNSYTGLGSPVANVLIPNLIKSTTTQSLNAATGSFAPGTIVTIDVAEASTPTTSGSTALTPATSPSSPVNSFGALLFFTGSQSTGSLGIANLPPAQSSSNSGTAIFTSASSLIGTKPGLPGLPSHGPVLQLATVVDDPAANSMDPNQPKDDGQGPDGMGVFHGDPLLLTDPVFSAHPTGVNQAGMEGNYAVTDALFADWEWLDQRQNTDSAGLQGDGRHTTGSAAALVAMALLTWPCGTSVVHAEEKKRKTLPL